MKAVFAVAAVLAVVATVARGQIEVGGSGITDDKDAIIKCPVQEIANGFVQQDGRTLFNGEEVIQDTSIRYECDEGYNLVGDSVLTCIKATKTFDRPVPRCEPIVCPDPGTPLNGGRTGSTFTYLSSVTFNCDPGYNLVGSRRRTCRADGSWSGSPVTCRPVDCGEPGTPQNGGRTLNPNTLFPSTVSFTCNRGYDLTGTTSANCQADGTWSQPPPTCRLVMCCELEAPRNGAKQGDGTDYEDVTSFSCDQGFQLVGPERRTCQADGTWTGEPVRCEPIMCPVPRTIDNGGYSATTLNVGSTVTFYCDTGYHLSADPELTCLPSGKWDKPLPECDIVNCGNPGSPENGGRQGDDFEFRMSVSFSCNPGYRLVGSMTRFCQHDGTWTGSPAMCNLIVCGDPGTPVNGGRTLTNMAVDGQVTWTCDLGYRLIGSPMATCKPTGSWSAPTPICEQNLCADPGTPLYSTRTNALQALFEPGEDTAVTCNRGFSLEGRKDLMCMPNGSWNYPLPLCEADRCLDPGTPENGFREVENFFLDSTVRYQCNPGYRLVGPEMRTCVFASETGVRPDLASSDRLQWDNSLPSCVRIECVDPGVPLNGVREGNDFNYLDAVMYSCNDGYVLVGSPAAVCMSDGRWSNPLPICTPVRCPDPGQLTNGARRLSGTMFRDTVMWTCDLSYVLVGSPSARCQPDGTWSNPMPICRLASCPDPGTPDNGYRNLDGATVGSTVEYFCNDGYRLVGPKQRDCLPTRDWSLELPVCEVVMCPDPLFPVNGGRMGNDFSYAMSVRFFCNEGYRLNGVPAAVCLANGSWSDPTPTCQIIDCGDPGQVINGRRALTSTVYGSQVGFSCVSGYVLMGSPSATCGLNGRWSEPLPQCIRRQCPDPGTPTFGSRILEGLRFNDNVNWRCNVGYSILGDPSAVCQANGQWSNPTPACTPNMCADPGIPLFGGRTLEGLIYQNRVDWTCDNGYVMDGQPSAICTAAGTWTNPVPVCEPVDCGDPGFPINGGRTLGGTTLNSRVTFTCDAGYRMDGELEAVCLPTGSWSRPPPRCIIIECPDIAPPANGDRLITSRVVGSDASFTCDDGYTLRGVEMVTCLVTGQWSDQPPVCEIVDCGDLPAFANGAIDFTATTFKAQARYKCDPGYNLVGSNVRDCFANGIWNPEAPSCEKITCGNPGVPANGQRIGEDFTYEARVSFLCDINFQLNGQPSAVCQADGTWSNPLPNCDPDCLVGEYGPFGPCSVTCGDGTQIQTRAVMQTPAGLGRPCPELQQSQSCNPRPCIQCEDQYPEGAIVYRLTQVDISVSTCIVIVVDESNSMAGEHAWLPGMSEGLEQNLIRQGIGGRGSQPNTYSLVGYGRRAPDFYSHFLEDDRGRRVFDSASFPQAARKLYADPEGRVEDGYEAIMFALNNTVCESNGTTSVAKNLIFISDEDRDVTDRGRSTTRNVLKRFLRRNNWLPNVVIDNTFACKGDDAIGVDSSLTAYIGDNAGSYGTCEDAQIGPGYATTRRDYTNLALELGGASWDINVLRQGGSLAASFTNAFTDVKTSEIRRATDQCRRCACTDIAGSGQFRCVPDNDQARCKCIADNGQWDPEAKACAGLPEPLPCIVSQWSSWASCSASCGVGSRSRDRQVRQRPVNNGEACPSLSEVTTCVLRECPRDCAHPGSPTNGQTTPSALSRTSFRPNERVDFSCDSGYRLTGLPSAICLSSGRWSQPVPICRRLDCNPGAVTYESASGGLCADVHLIIDQSRSMEGEIAWLPGFVSNLETSLRGKNIGVISGGDNWYSITGYGQANPNHLGKVYTTNGDNLNCYPASRFASVNRKVQADPNGRVEDGYEAIAKSLDIVKCRRGGECTVGCNVILVSDEDRDNVNATITTNIIRSRLLERGCILNVVVDNTYTANGVNALGVDSNGNAYIEQSGGRYRVENRNVVVGQGYSNTKEQYTDVALELGGGAWDINILRQGGNPAESFTSGMVDFKADEILNQLTGCQQCTCSAIGEKNCRPAPNQSECSCRAAGQRWNSNTNTCT